MKLEQTEEEMEMLLNEIPHATLAVTYDNDDGDGDGDAGRHQRSLVDVLHALNAHGPLPFLGHNVCGNGNGHANGMMIESSTGSSLICRTPSPVSSSEVDELLPFDRLRAMRIGDGMEPPIARKPVASDGRGKQPINPFVLQNGFDGVTSGVLLADDYGASHRSVLARSHPFDDGRQLSVLNSQPHCFANSSIHDGNSYGKGIWDFDPLLDEPYWQSQQNGFALSHHLGAFNTLSSPQSLVSRPHYGSTMANRRLAALPHSCAPESLPTARFPGHIGGFSYEDNLIMQSRGVRRNRSYSRGSPAMSVERVPGPRRHGSPTLHLRYDNLKDIEGSIYYIAKDQHGCRLLQNKFDEGTPQEVAIIFEGIVNHVVELMVNPFGNYLVQKMLDKCTEEQMMRILLMLTEVPTELVRISMTPHGTRAVQKMIATLRTRQQVALVVSALQPGFLDLVKDLNGNHVVQRCLQSLSPEDNKFIFDAAAKHCVDIATHRHGCCVLQRCIFYSTGEHRVNLLAEICANGLQLAQDAFGNYVVQYILELKNPLAAATLVSQFEGNYVHLSMQKFSSNVVEKCLKFFAEDDRAQIVVELLSVSCFEQLLQDPYANYVIQAALGKTKGHVYAALVGAIRPHAAVLRTSPYCKRIFSRSLLKK